MFAHKTDKAVAVLWDSITEPAQAAAQIRSKVRREIAMQYASGEYSHSAGDDKWFGCSVEELRRRISEGWAEGVDRVLALECAVRDASTVAAKSIRRRRTREAQGDEVDMQSIWRGDLSRAWGRTRRQSRPSTKVVSIICNVGANAGVSADELFWSGAAALRLAAELSAAGYAVGIYAGQASSMVSRDGLTANAQFVEIKAPDAPLDLSKLAAVTCLSGYWRTALFAGKCVSMDLVGKDVAHNLGISEPSEIRVRAESVGLTGCIVEPAIYSEKDAVAWVATAVKLAGEA